MDPEIFLDVANYIKNLKPYPIFETAYYLYTIIGVRKELGADSIGFSRRHPLACLFASMAACFAGPMVASILLGESPLDAIKEGRSVMLAAACWYALFYSPLDLCFKLATWTPFKAVLIALKSVLRCRKIHLGVLHAQHVYPQAMLVWILVGTAKGTGNNLISFVWRYFYGLWDPTRHELLMPTFSTKACLVVASVFAIEGQIDVLAAPHSVVFLLVCLFLIYFKLAILLLKIRDPFLPLENLFCAIFLGGLADTLTRALTSKNSATAGAKTQEEKERKLD